MYFVQDYEGYGMAYSGTLNHPQMVPRLTLGKPVFPSSELRRTMKGDERGAVLESSDVFKKIWAS